jgi:L-rhamnose-H+ transport protein
MNPLLGIFYHAVGGFAAGSFYIPYKRVKNWAWETYWLLGGFFAWILAPWIVSLIFIPDIKQLFDVLTFKMLFWPYFFGLLWGIGGLTFGLTMRFLGMSLGMALALGLTATFGTLIPPIYFQQFDTLAGSLSGQITLAGVAVCLFGIALTGKAGILKDKEVSEDKKKEHIEEFNLRKGIWVAIFAGIMSACFAFGIAAGKPLADKAIELGTPLLFSNSPIFIVIMVGGFTTNFIWCIILGIKNKTIRDYIRFKNISYLSNFLFSALAGITWYFQFMFYGMGTTKMGKYDFASWSIHMSFIIVFSNLWGLFLKEWAGSGKKTIRVIITGLLILVLSTLIIGLGNYLQQYE